LAQASGNPMSERELRDEVLTLIIAGHDTTALALSSSFYLLAKNPAAESILREELQTGLGCRPPSTKDFSRLRYAEMVIKESLRLYPTAWGISRVALSDFQVGGYNIPAGAAIVMGQWGMRRDPRYYESPLEFKLQRWETEKAKTLPKFAYFPFGGGPRRCISHAFAWMEAVLVLAAIVPRVRFTLVTDHPVEAIPSFTLYPRHGIKMGVTKQ
jgi:cytochrome P450